jgi:hypothetical protein
MANLVPYKKTNNAIIKADKFLPRIKTSFISSGKDFTKLSESPLLKIERKFIKIDSLLKDSLLLSKKENEKGRVKKEEKKFEQREKELENKKAKLPSGVKVPSLPGVGILGWIRNFIVQTVLGFLAVRLIDHLPKLLKVLPVIVKVSDFFIDMGGKLLDGLVTFVDKAYDVVDNTRKFTKQLGGEGLAQNFDKFAGALSTMLDVAVIAALSAASMGDDFGGSGGPTSKTKPALGSKPKVTTGSGGKFKFRIPGTGPKITGTKGILSFVRPFLKRIPIPVIGALIDFGLSWALGEDPGRAAFRAIGAGILGSIGTGLAGALGLAGGPLAIATAALGGLAGGALGDMAGGALYDLFFGGKKTQKGKVAKAAGGGQPTTRGGKLVGGPAKRSVKKKKTPRTLTVTPKKLKPGSAVGGENKVKQLFPETKDKTKMSPFDVLKNAYDGFSKSSGLGSLIALAIKPLMGDRPSYADYKNAGIGVNNWMNQSVATGTYGYAGGGEVKIESIVSGEDYSDVIAKSLQDSVTPQVDKTIQDLMRQLNLKQPTKKEPDKTDPTLKEEGGGGVDGGGMTGGQWGPLLDLIAGKESGGNYEAMYPSTTLPGATKMTISEVARRATGAVGKYQQLPQYLVNRARAAGLNPDKDLYSPENQEKIIINVNIKGRGGEKWLKGEISDEQFMQGLSQEFASLPNADGKFYYPGQRSAMTPEKVKSALSKVKRGGYSQQELAAGMGRGPSGATRGSIGGSVVEYITGDPNTPFGRFDRAGHGTTDNYHDHIAFKDRSTAVRAYNFFKSKGIQVTEFKGYGPVGGHASGSYHYSGLAFDIPGAQWGGSGAIGARDYAGSAKVRRLLKEFMGGGSTQIASKFHGGIGYANKDGMTLKLHKGEMYKVVDKDSVDLFGRDFIEDIINVENKAQLVAKAPSIIEKLKLISGYTDYERPEPEVVYVPSPVEYLPLPMGSGGSTIIAGGGGGDDYVNSSMEQTLAQIG